MIIMSQHMDQSPQQHWCRAAKKFAHRFNRAWWLDAFALPLLVAATALAAGLIFYRQSHAAPPSLAFSGLIAFFVIGVAVFLAWRHAKVHFISENEALVRLEIRHGLHNALSAARAGHGAWPPIPATPERPRWNWPRLVVPPIATVTLLVAAFYLPLSHAETPVPMGEPAAVTTLAKNIEKLRAQETIAPEDLDRLEKQVEQLRQNNAKDWFSHASLEASDSLKQAQQNQLRELSRELAKSEKSLKSLQNDAAKLSPEQRAQQEKNFQEALEKMEQGGLKPNKELLDQLKNLDPKDIENLPPEQLEKLRQELKKRGQEAKDAAGEHEENDDWANEPAEKGEEGEGEGEGEQPEFGDGEGKDGGEHAPEFLGPLGSETESGDLQKIDPEDRRDLSPGDLLKTESREHEKNLDSQSLQSGGSTNQSGQGGSRLWQESLLPQEQKALKGYFK